MFDIEHLDPEERFAVGSKIKERWVELQKGILLSGEKSEDPTSIYLCGGVELMCDLRIKVGTEELQYKIELKLLEPGVISGSLWTEPKEESLIIPIPDFRQITPDEAADIIIYQWPVYEVMDS